MVVDQFGMIGLLTFIRAAETDPNLVSLALGADLTTLGLNLNSEVTLFPTFGGPWAETPCRPQDIDFHVPHEHLTNTTIREKLAPVKLNRYKDDILFYMFYTNVGDVLQLAAATELYNRDWRYHKDERVWITRAHGMMPSEKTALQEYLLICCQDVRGGLIDKPGKSRDFYHTCYTLSGLSVAQHYSYLSQDSLSVLGNPKNVVEPTHPVYNVCVNAAADANKFFEKLEVPPVPPSH